MTRSHKIGWLVLVLAVLFMLWRLPRLHGQGFGSFSHDQPFLAKDVSSIVPDAGSNYIYSFSNIARWWVASDVPVGQAISNQWIDRVSSSPFQQANSSKYPTNTANGVWFNGAADPNAAFLTNEPPIPAGGMVNLMVLSIDTEAGKNLDILFSASGQGYLRIGTDQKLIVYDEAIVSSTSPDVWPDNRMVDWLLVRHDSYTNNVLFHNAGSQTFLYGNWQWYGSEPYSDGGYNGLKGYIREIIIWTNCDNFSGMTAPLSATIRSNLHWYVTNKYTDISP